MVCFMVSNACLHIVKIICDMPSRIEIRLLMNGGSSNHGLLHELL